LPFFARFLGLDLGFKFRSAKLAYLLVNQKRVSENHWFYFADADFIINRVAEFNNFAEQRLPKNKTVLCCEVTETQHFSVERVAKDLSRAGLVSPEDIVDAKTLNITHAYPIYDRSYEKETKRTETFFAGFQDIRLLGRQAGFVHKDLDEIYAEAKHITRDMLSNHLVT
jgi:protoporphyrinogen oxidase